MPFLARTLIVTALIVNGRNALRRPSDPVLSCHRHRFCRHAARRLPPGRRLDARPSRRYAGECQGTRFHCRALRRARARAGRVRDGSSRSPSTLAKARCSGFNVAGVVTGTAFPDQYIVVSAHFDHIGAVGPGAQCRPSGADSICNGADDNASGTAGLLALARYFMTQRPRHSLLLVAFDAEESGDAWQQRLGRQRRRCRCNRCWSM